MSAVDSGRSSLSGLTLDALLRAEKRATPRLAAAHPPARSHSNHTLLDAMREEHRQGHNGDKAPWKTFMDKLRLKRHGAAWACAETPIPPRYTATHDSVISVQNLDIPVPDGHSQRYNSLGFLLSNSAETTQEATQPDLIHRYRDSAGVSDPAVMPPSRNLPPQISHENPHPARTEDDEGNEPVVREGRIRLGVALAEERAESARETEAEATASAPPPEEAQPARVSLMELLDETESQMGSLNPRYTTDDVSDDDAAVDGGGVAKAEFSCCVCMLRSKGAAFIPCGHTFCRQCSRELWVQRGSCPLCNTFILEILDIF